MEIKNQMSLSVKEEILNLIAQAKSTRGVALSAENRKDLGYPYLAGYQTATLDQIAALAALL